MRRDFKGDVETLYAALKALGYTRCKSNDPRVEWRFNRFHLLIRPRTKHYIAISIHEDRPCRLPPFHKATHKSAAIKKELERIEKAYQQKKGS